MTAPGFDLILLRHGNTFAPGEPVIRLGRYQDLPLVETGVVQAHAAAAALSKRRLFTASIYASSLKRAHAFARIVAGELSAPPPVIDDRLIEIDYGPWSGLTDEAIATHFGHEPLEGWNRFGRWPTDARWGEREEDVAARTAAFAQDLIARHGPAGTAIAVSSAGTLRYFLALAPETFASMQTEGRLKIATGHFAHLRCVDGVWSLVGWNLAPDQFAEG